MSNYYDYREVKVMIAHKLMTMEGWKVYGYKADESDSMTDYYSPAYWDGVAEKNGYILCVDVYGASEAKEIKRYNKNVVTLSKEVSDKIAKLERITVQRGASIHEEQTAKEKIEILKGKAQECKNDYEIIGVIPAHMENPSRCNWHIEKDGVIVAKGNGILKYKDAYDYYNYDSRKKYYDDFKKDSKKWANEWVNNVTLRGYYTEEKAKEQVKNVIEDMQDGWKVINAFEKFISKIDTTCGGMLGDGEIEQYEKVTVTEYKKENKAIECEGEVKEGQCFILKTNFNYGCFTGLVYRIHETEYKGKKYYHAYKLNGKLTKECTGSTSKNNYWSIDEKFNQWIEKGYIAFCKIEEVKTPYEVEKFIKKTVSNNSNHVTPDNTENTTENNKMSVSEEKQEINYTFTIKEDTDTRDDSKIYLATCNESLSKDEFKHVMTYIKSIGGYYSRFKHAFLFKEFPSDLVDKFTEIQVKDIPVDEVNFGDAESQCNIQDETQDNSNCETQQDNEEQEPQKESVYVTHNEQMKTIECVTRTNSENAMKLLKGHGFVYLAGIKKFVIEYSKNVMEWLHESFIVESA